MSQTRQIALYVHWPFCVSKCPYCDFNSHVRSGVDIDAWRHALLCDLDHEAGLTAGASVGSVFFGGGTPSLMPPSLVGAVLEKAAELWGFEPDAEITLEANPSSVEAANFAALATAGINRVSLGLQSLEEEALRMLGRAHSVAESLSALEVAQRHFGRQSIDLIYARPGQTTASWTKELNRALALGTEHISLYQLTIEPRTRFATDVRLGALVPLDDDAAADMFAMTREVTEATGLAAYEISNHARPGCESRHNLAYWRYQDYVGVGPGAHGRRGGFATERHRKPENYLAAVDRQGHGLSSERPLPVREQVTEALMIGLRLSEGVDLAGLSARFGLPRHDLVDDAKLAFHRQLGFVDLVGSRLTVTEAGMPLLDGLLPEIIALDAETA